MGGGGNHEELTGKKSVLSAGETGLRGKTGEAGGEAVTRTAPHLIAPH